MQRSALCATLLAGAVLAPTLHAQSAPDPIRTYALTNARIVLAPGRVIERGTVVLQDRRIVAVGERVQVPAGALTLDLTGRTIYPGLVDAATSIGLPEIVARGGRGGGPQSGPSADAEPPPETRPDRVAANAWTPSEAVLAGWRRAGVTTLGLAFDGGIFPGQTSAVSLAESDAGTVVLRTPVSLQVLLGRRRGGYPGTLMGALAYIEQAFLDAQHAIRVEDAFRRNAASAPRPSYDPDDRALAPAVRGTLPVWFHASAERDIERVIDLAGRASVGNFVLVGAQEGYRAVDALRAAGRAVIVSLDWPDPNSVTGRAYELHTAPVAGEDSAAARADSAVARLLRGNAAALASAGLTIALSSHGLDTPADFRDHVLAAVEAGLAPDAALRALTTAPAALLGLDGLVGTVEPGKLANLVVVEGDLFRRDGKLREVFVEGIRHQIPDEPAPARGPRRAGAAATAAGEWTGSIELGGTMMPFTMTLTDAGGTLAGEIAGETGSASLSGERTGDEVVLRGTFRMPGATAMAFSITGRITGSELRGTLTAQGQEAIPFTARLRDPGFDATRGGGR